MGQDTLKLPITVVLAIKNEEVNLPKCLAALGPAEKIYLIDSHSSDNTAKIANDANLELIQFDYLGGYPKKRQWALDNLKIDTPWVFMLDADEVIPDTLWEEINFQISGAAPDDAYLITKGFHFLGRAFRFGGFSHAAILLFKNGKAKFEHILDDPPTAPDMEIHERLIVDGSIGSLRTPLIHEDFKGLESYIARHNSYSTWEAKVRNIYRRKNRWGEDAIKANLFGNAQERRRYLKLIAIRIPLESWLWFFYHYFICLGFLEGKPGLIACQIRASYISQVRAKIYEMQIRPDRKQPFS